MVVGKALRYFGRGRSRPVPTVRPGAACRTRRRSPVPGTATRRPGSGARADPAMARRADPTRAPRAPAAATEDSTRESSSDVPPYESDPLPGWTGLEAHAPCEEATRVTLDVKMPVAAGIGVHVHVLMSQQLMTRASLGAGDWVALAVCEGPEAVGNVGGAPGGPPGTPGTPRGASTPGTPGSATRQAAQALVGLSIADPPPAPAVHIPALLARNVTLDSASAPDGTSHGASAAAAAAATGKLGRFTVMARVHPNPKANGLDAVQLARKVWHSLGSPAAGGEDACAAAQRRSRDAVGGARARGAHGGRAVRGQGDAQAVGDGRGLRERRVAREGPRRRRRRRRRRSQSTRKPGRDSCRCSSRSRGARWTAARYSPGTSCGCRCSA